MVYILIKTKVAFSIYLIKICQTFTFTGNFSELLLRQAYVNHLLQYYFSSIVYCFGFATVVKRTKRIYIYIYIEMILQFPSRHMEVCQEIDHPYNSYLIMQSVVFKEKLKVVLFHNVYSF